ncbi:MAG TPA: signal peptidase I, partial [Hyphomicrobiaceae bacterium]|nr:signal peptidase I [Hyphomicrobiaceae bacterium]
MSVDSDAARAGDSGWHETGKIVIQALILAVIVRIFFYQPFNIPSGSMKDTLLVGDYLFVSKLSYGYSRFSFPFGIIPFSGRIFGAQPKRGDVVVFKLPRDTDKDYIKRVIGLPGDEVVVKGGIVYINGTAVPRVRDGEHYDWE